MAGGDAETTRQGRGRAIVKPNSQQLPLFPRPALLSRPFSLAPSPDEIRICSGCGKQIITEGCAGILNTAVFDVVLI
jgi:hypothetical protein